MPATRVLVVDDDEAVRRSLVHALRRDGFEVDAAADGAQALDTLARVRPAVVILDVLMPEPNGLEVCRQLRARNDFTPILMLTARDLVADRVAGLDAGADDYLVKPFALDELRARLRALLRRSGSGQEVLRFADIEVDLAGYRARRGDRAPAARTLPGSGLGLGLAIVRQVAENAGGSVAAEPLPRGVRMRLQLPAVVS